MSPLTNYVLRSSPKTLVMTDLFLFLVLLQGTLRTRKQPSGVGNQGTNGVEH